MPRCLDHSPCATPSRPASKRGQACQRRSDNILITPGGQAALFATHNAVCDQGDTALYIDPYYATYPGTIRGIGAVPKSIQAHAENDFQPKAADIAAVAKGAKSLLINSPNNPTGVIYSPETLGEIAQVCIDNDLWLISDEVYDTQIWEGTHLSPRALPNMAERTLVVGSMSKSHAMTGSRIGWVCGPAEVMNTSDQSGDTHDLRRTGIHPRRGPVCPRTRHPARRRGLGPVPAPPPADTASA